MVTPIFYEVDHSDVRKQTGEFGKVFEETCKNKTDDEKQRCRKALADVANMAGEDSRNWYFFFSNFCLIRLKTPIVVFIADI